ncbi:MAG: hypothetical protein GYB66_12370 [Chloroflexi bacterium]|nr:hypothetical protein [Chloroflexota bacterium]
MRWRQMLILLGLLLTALVLSGCTDDGGNSSLDLFGAEPTQLDSTSAESVSTTFLDAWRDQDYETMYSLITPNARDAFSLDEFISIYQSVDETLGLNELAWEIAAGPLVQGNSATVDYIVTFDTDLLGVFRDPNPDIEPMAERTMWLVATSNEGWRVAWSRTDIFSGWTNESRLRVERVMPTRGNIYDRNGKILVDQNGVSIGIYLIENNIPNTSQCVIELARILRKEEDDIQAIFDRYLSDTRFLVGEISQETANAENGILSSVCNYEPRPRDTRQYYDRVAPHIIGYIGQIPADQQANYRLQGYPDDALVGLAGVEQAFEAELRGTIGIRLYIESNTGIPIRTVAQRAPQSGNSLYLTIDRDLQLGVQAVLAEAYDYAQPTWAPTSPGAAAVVMNVNTGEILAIASYPDFDPSVFNPDTAVLNPAQEIQRFRDDPRRPLVNRATEGTYPLGSVFKVFSMIAGLDSGVWSANRTNVCTGTWDGTQYNDVVRTDWLPQGHGLLDMKGGLVNSCNPYFWQMSVALNNADPFLLPNYAVRMGFGQAPPFQGISTDQGLIPNPDWKQRQPEGSLWGQGDASNLVIGQGEMGVNPLQVVRATAVVANNGTLYEPLIVREVGFIGDEPEITYQPVGEDLGLRPDVLDLTREAMCEVTTRGTANFMYQGWYEHNAFQIIVCGKTGTAQSGGINPHAWFNAFAPAENPEIAVAVVVERSCEGSEVASPIVYRIMELYFPQLRQDYGWPTLWQTGCAEIGPD